MNGRRYIPFVMISIILGSFIALSGCISPQDFVPEPGPGPLATISPASTTLPGVPEGERGTDLLPVTGSRAPQYYVKTPYGYLLTSPTTGVRFSIIEIKDDVDATGQRVITGKLKNDENYRIDYVSINFNLYNSNGNLIGNTYASVHSLGPGKTWKFTTNPFTYRDYQYYEMAGIFTA